MTIAHFIDRCTEGFLLGQCRCIGPRQVVTRPCPGVTHGHELRVGDDGKVVNLWAAVEAEVDAVSGKVPESHALTWDDCYRLAYRVMGTNPLLKKLADEMWVAVLADRRAA